MQESSEGNTQGDGPVEPLDMIAARRQTGYGKCAGNRGFPPRSWNTTYSDITVYSRVLKVIEQVEIQRVISYQRRHPVRNSDDKYSTIMKSIYDEASKKGDFSAEGCRGALQ